MKHHETHHLHVSPPLQRAPIHNIIISHIPHTLFFETCHNMLEPRCIRIQLRGRRRRRSLFALLLIVVTLLSASSSMAFLASSPSSASSSNRPRRIQQPRERQHDISSSSLFFSTTPSSSLREKLESLTVKELRDLLDQSNIDTRGIRSKLKLKKDLIDFLDENLSNKSDHDPDNSTIENNSQTNYVEMQQTSSEKNQGPEVDASGKSSPSKPRATMPPLPNNPKDALLEKVYRRYPGLRNLPNSTYAEEAEDVRRTHHPIFRGSRPNAHTSADMDITFVGTASCTPSHTRGVSCTAVRLNWQRRGVYGYPGGGDDAPSTFVGGTWLFDCGECTQVSDTYRM